MTYSVAAVDRDEGVMGVAVQSHWLAVGGLLPNGPGLLDGLLRGLPGVPQRGR